MSTADGMRKMLALGIPIEQALEIVEAFEMRPNDARSERNRRYYEKRKASEKRLKASESDGEARRLKASEKRLTSDATSRAHVEDKLLNSVIEPQEVKKEKKEAQATPRSELERVLDPVHAQAVIDHRQRIRKGLTAHAASLLARKLERCPDPNAAADVMIEKGWQSIEAEWLNQPARGSPQRQSHIEPAPTFDDLARFYDAQAERESGSSEGTVPLLQNLSKH